MIYWETWELPKIFRETVGAHAYDHALRGEWKCDDNRVEKVSFYGYTGATPETPVGMSCRLVMKDGENKEFKRDCVTPASQSALIQEAEAWLATLPAADRGHEGL
jgi:hypothetical protein